MLCLGGNGCVLIDVEFTNGKSATACSTEDGGVRPIIRQKR